MNDLKDNLDRLDEISKTMNLISKDISDGYVKFECEGGDCETWHIFNDTNQISILKAHLPKGCKFPVHPHLDSNEIIVIYRGQISVKIDDEVHILSVGESYFIPKNKLHEHYAIEDSWVIGITIPSDISYPIKY